MPPRDLVTVRLSPDGLKKLDEIAAECSTTRAAVIRAFLGRSLNAPHDVAAVKARLMQDV